MVVVVMVPPLVDDVDVPLDDDDVVVYIAVGWLRESAVVGLRGMAS